MKKGFQMTCSIAFVPCFLGFAIMTGCENQWGLTDAQISVNDTVNSSLKDSDHNTIITETDYYKLTEKNGLYTYVLYDKNGNLVKSEENLTGQPEIMFVDNHLLRVTTQGGTGLGTQSGFYYDIDQNLISDAYPSILDQHGELLVFATEKSVIVKSIFGEHDYFYEMSSFANPLSEVAFPFVCANFSEDGTSVCVTYLTGKDFEEVSEIYNIADKVGSSQGSKGTAFLSPEMNN